MELSLDKAYELRDEGITSTETPEENDGFFDAAMEAIKSVAAKQDTFIIDDVWAVMPPTYVTDKRAMGAAITRARASKMIAPTGIYRSSAQPQCHANPRQVWKSLLMRVV